MKKPPPQKQIQKMDKFLGHDIPEGRDRVTFLRDNCDAVEELGYTKALPGCQLEALKEQLVENNIQLRDVRADKKAANKEFNEQIKQLEEQNDDVTAKLKSRTEFVNEPCYKFIDGDEVGYYNADGVLVYTRPARPEERQRNITQVLRDFSEPMRSQRTGTDD